MGNFPTLFEDSDYSGLRTSPSGDLPWKNGTVLNVGAGFTVDTPAGIGGDPLTDASDRMKLVLWGPSTSLGFSALSLRCTDDGTDINTNGGLLVSHATNYSATPGYAHWFQVYAATGMEGTILGCNTSGRYLRFEVGPTWPASEIGRARHVGDNTADWVFGWSTNRTITASQSGTTVTATVGTFTSADVGRWICWGTSSSGTVADSFRITAYTDATHVTVDTSRPGGIASQQARICTPLDEFKSTGSLYVSNAVGIGGPPTESANRFPLTMYGPASSIGYCAALLTCSSTVADGLGIYSYSPLYTTTVGVQGWAEIVALPGMRGLSVGSLVDDTDLRFVLGTSFPTHEMGRVKYRGTNKADWFFNWTVVRTHTASQSGTTVTATVGSFASTDVGKYVCWSGAYNAQVYKITAYISATQVTVDTNVAGGIVPQSMRVCEPKAMVDENGNFSAKNIGTPGIHFPLARVNTYNVYRTPPTLNVSTLALTANFLYKVPIFINTETTITEIAISVSTAAASSHIRLGLRRFVPSTGEFTTLVSDCGVIDSSTTGLKSITGLSLTLSPGLYFAECVSEGSPTVAASSTAGNVMSFGANYTSNSTAYPIGHVKRSFTYAALPTDETGVANDTATINTMPMIGVR